MLGIKVNFTDNKIEIVLNNKESFAVSWSVGNDLYELTSLVRNRTEARVSKRDMNPEIWYKRFGHLNYNDLSKLVKENMVEGLTCKNFHKIDKFCQVCIEAKHRQALYQKIRWRSARVIQLIQTNVCSVSQESWDGTRYLVSFIDDFSQFGIIYLMKLKDEIRKCFKDYKGKITN